MTSFRNDLKTYSNTMSVFPKIIHEARALKSPLEYAGTQDFAEMIVLHDLPSLIKELLIVGCYGMYGSKLLRRVNRNNSMRALQRN